jgi:multiple sugar transport system permease protein/putative aldouronate transport system permease protein
MTIVKNGYQLIPQKLSLAAYDLMLSGKRLYTSYGVTLFVTSVGTLLSLLTTSMMAYALSSKRLRYANAINFYVFFTMLFGGGLIPWYIVVTRILLLRNSIWAMIIPYLVNPWFMFLLRNYFRSVPESLMESARIDGAGDLRILFRIVLPLSGPALATIGLFYALLFWNDWWLSMLLIDRERLYPLQFLLRALLSNLMNVATSLNPQMKTIQVVPAYSVRMATVVVTIGPIIMLYPFLQRYFVKGITVGAIKG